MNGSGLKFISTDRLFHSLGRTNSDRKRRFFSLMACGTDSGVVMAGGHHQEAGLEEIVWVFGSARRRNADGLA
jgi:hypothetical protein